MSAIATKLPTIGRVVLGLGFLTFGLNGFLNFLPPAPEPERANAFLGALAATGYMFPLIKGTEVLAGALLLSGRLVPLALVLLAPVLVNILAFHAVLAPAGLVMPLLLASIAAALAWVHRDAYAPLFRATTPSDDAHRPALRASRSAA